MPPLTDIGHSAAISETFMPKVIPSTGEKMLEWHYAFRLLVSCHIIIAVTYWRVIGTISARSCIVVIGSGELGGPGCSKNCPHHHQHHYHHHQQQQPHIFLVIAMAILIHTHSHSPPLISTHIYSQPPHPPFTPFSDHSHSLRFTPPLHPCPRIYIC